MSSTIVVYPIWSALWKAETYLDEDHSDWKTVNEKQKILIKCYKSREKQDKISLDEIKEIESIASIYYQDINDFLKEKGFDIRLDPFPSGDGFGVASVFHLLADWLSEGESHSIQKADGGTFRRAKYFPGVKLDKPGRNFKVIESKNYGFPIIYLPTKSEYRAFITVADEPRKEFDLFAEVINIVSGIDKKRPKILDSYSSVIFPKVNLDIEEDISWLEKMFFVSLDGGPAWYINQAKQQSRLQINELGLKAESAVALALRKCAAIVRDPLIIDRPFFLWISHPKLAYPVFTAYITEEHWMDPGTFQLNTKK